MIEIRAAGQQKPVELTMKEAEKALKDNFGIGKYTTTQSLVSTRTYKDPANRGMQRGPERIDFQISFTNIRANRELTFWDGDKYLTHPAGTNFDIRYYKSKAIRRIDGFDQLVYIPKKGSRRENDLKFDITGQYIIQPGEYDKMLFVLLNPECNVSPFKTGPKNHYYTYRDAQAIEKKAAEESDLFKKIISQITVATAKSNPSLAEVLVVAQKIGLPSKNPNSAKHDLINHLSINSNALQRLEKSKKVNELFEGGEAGAEAFAGTALEANIYNAFGDKVHYKVTIDELKIKASEVAFKLGGFTLEEYLRDAYNTPNKRKHILNIIETYERQQKLNEIQQNERPLSSLLQMVKDEQIIHQGNEIVHVNGDLKTPLIMNIQQEKLNNIEILSMLEAEHQRDPLGFLSKIEKATLGEKLLMEQV